MPVLVELLHKHCIVHEMESQTDYRTLLSAALQREEGAKRNSWFWVTDNEASLKEATEEIDAVLRMLGATVPRDVILAPGFERTLALSCLQTESGLTVGRFDFEELCGSFLSAADYRAIGRHCSLVILEKIPVLRTSLAAEAAGMAEQRKSAHSNDKARRFVTLIDELYEARTAVICSAAAPPADLFVKNMPVQTADVEGVPLGVDQAMSAEGTSVGASASIRELAFAFDRAASRLVEMTSPAFWERILEDKGIPTCEREAW
jgi:protein AFG1